MTDTMDEAIEAEVLAPRAPVEIRNTGTVAEVRHKERIVEMIVVPYGEETLAEYPPGSGRLVRESHELGAYDGVERRAGAVRANRDHDRTKPVGRALSLHGSRAEGLIAEVRISRTQLGDETLELADDGTLAISAGFAPMADGQVFTENRSRRRITRAFLDHIAFTADPAYVGAGVLSVRHTDAGLIVPTPFVEPVVDTFADDVRSWIDSMRG